MPTKPLQYFNSVHVPDELHGSFTQLEDVLQREHGIDGSHPIATQNNSGMMTAEQAQKLEQVWQYIQKLQAANEQASS